MVRMFRILLVVAVAMIAASGLGPGAARADEVGADPEQPRPAAHYTDDSQDFTRSLIYSGAVALSVASIGLAMVGWRRRQW